MRLYKLIGLEIAALEKDYEQTQKNIAAYEDILENHSSMSKVIDKELSALKKAYAVPRKTTVENAAAAVYEEKKFEEMEVIVLMDRFGYCKCIDPAAYERNKEAADSENRHVLRCMNTDKITVFTNTGRLHLLRVMDIPAGRFRDKGTPVDNLCNYDSSGEYMVYVDTLSHVIASHLLFVSQGGYLKMVAGSEFDASKRTIAATKLMDNDAVCAIFPVQGEKNIVLQTKNGVFIRFLAEEIPEKKKGAIGVRGIRLAEGDKIEQACLITNPTEESITYKDKEILAARIKLSRRDTKGTKLRL